MHKVVIVMYGLDNNLHAKTQHRFYADVMTIEIALSLRIVELIKTKCTTASIALKLYFFQMIVFNSLYTS